jgi:hypothetical protein
MSWRVRRQPRSVNSPLRAAEKFSARAAAHRRGERLTIGVAADLHLAFAKIRFGFPPLALWPPQAFSS